MIYTAKHCFKLVFDNGNEVSVSTADGRKDIVSVMAWDKNGNSHHFSDDPEYFDHEKYMSAEEIPAFMEWVRCNKLNVR